MTDDGFFVYQNQSLLNGGSPWENDYNFGCWFRYSFRGPSGPRRPLPIPQPDYRIHEMNKRLQQRTDESDNLWWDAFANEFFEDDASITLTFVLEDGPKRHSKRETSIKNPGVGYVDEHF